MKKKSSIIKLSVIGFVLIIGLILSFCSFHIGLSDYNSFASSIKLGLDLKGGIYAVYEADTTDTKDIDARMAGTRASITNLLTSKGYSEAEVREEGKYRLRVEVPDVANPESILQILGEPAQIEFILDGETTPVITGDHVLDAAAGYDNGQPVVSLSLNSEGADRFAKVTSENIGKKISIITIIGGERNTISSPSIESAITGGKAIINNMGTIEAAEELANQIKSGTFGVTLSLLECSTISATLGENALNMGLIAGIIGLFLVMVFMSLIYRMFGVMASFNLVIYTVLMLFILAVFPWVQLTLPGIAGILLSIGMAVDGNVIIYERIKDEYRSGKSIRASVYYGYHRAKFAIIDGNVTTLIAAIFLWIFGTGSVQGFAITLFIGIIISLFNSLVVTYGLIKYMVNINDHNAALYNLKRGKEFESLNADQNDSGSQMEIQKDEERKRAKKAEKRARKGGLGYER